MTIATTGGMVAIGGVAQREGGMSKITDALQTGPISPSIHRATPTPPLPRKQSRKPTSQNKQ